ncbi:penicillin-binding transpeptidase domain-containing protein [Brevibacillus choshinensis]|uniref:Penicillin-binding transpeptidase domain-containing protein n=1 Tax=Brevibacillus choshinensis TaxID=54911 RepID=A0ABX7FL06_BRECH|nr:penicillin-binding transpeptidase domain-containing protein [Brevibacillus choshinensis]QRG66761.1 penicillin-binding transpeptidase domain-containing protein [Brevibacillus choshinensis]
MKKTWVWFWSVFIVVLGGFGFVYWNMWQDSPQREGEKAKTAFSTFTTRWQYGQFSNMYEQLSTKTKQQITKEQFTQRYQNIYEGIEAHNISVEPLYNGPVQPGEDGTIKLHYRLSMDTFVDPISFTGKATLVKEKQGEGEGWYISWNPSFLLPDMQDGDKVRASTIPPKRGEILDRAGRRLATDRVVVDVGVNPAEWSQLTPAGRKQVSDILRLASNEVAATVQAQSSKKTSFIRIATLSDDDERIFQLTGTKGIVLQKKQVRYYPYKEALAHLIGYTGSISAEEYEKKKAEGYRSSDKIGKTGLEQMYEKRLKGSAGGRITIVNADGMDKKIVGERAAKNGDTLKLTIDAELQKQIYGELKKEAGAAAAIQPKTGEVLALVSSPAYDPNDFVLGMSTDKWNELNGNPQKPMLNRFAHSFAPGSTFKPITAAIGLDMGAITPDEEKDIDGLHWQKDSSWGNYEVTRVSDHRAPVNLQKALVYSDNIYFAQAALSIGEDNFMQKAKEFGFHESIPIPFPIEKSTLTNGEQMKNEIQLADSGYGQGEVTMTPLHLALAYSAFVNDGNMIYPFLFQEEKHDPYWKTGVMSKESAKLVQNDLLQVMEDSKGTGRGARVAGHRIAGKTGTAELKQKKGELGQENGWYAAFSVDDPKLLLVMMVEDVRGRGGSHVLDSKVKRIFTQALP